MTEKNLEITHKINVENFSPISDVSNMNVTDIHLLIGEQASGKSTLAKLIYFFRTFHKEFVNIIFMSEFENWENCRKAYITLLRGKFTNVFGNTNTFGDFNIAYFYSNNFYVTITPSGKYLNVNFEKLRELKQIWESAFKILQLNKESAFNVYASMIEDTNARNDIVTRVKRLFNEDFAPIYIPAGRALLSRPMLAKFIRSSDSNALFDNKSGKYSPFSFVDAPTRNYIDEVDRRIRPWFVSESHRGYDTKNDYDDYLKYLDDISKDILKGEYIIAKDEEYIQSKTNDKISLSYTSSGQQEVVWLLNTMKYYAYFGQKCFIVIEEPETHLHPDAQYLLVKYISAFKNKTESQILITTHSPYILSSFNNLFYADKCSKKCRGDISKVTDILPKQCWLDADVFSAYIMEGDSGGTTARPIKDKCLSMVDIAELDAVASEQDDEYEQMLQVMKGGFSSEN